MKNSGLLLFLVFMCFSSQSLLAQESVVPSDDVSIFWTGTLNDTHGSDEVMPLRFSQNGKERRDIFLKFDLTAFTTSSTYSSVKLKLYGSDEGIADIPLRVLKVQPDDANINWKEELLVFSNRPLTDYLSDNIAEVETAGDNVSKYFEWDITSWVNNLFAAGHKTVSLHLRQMSIPGSGGAAVEAMYFHSKENSSGKAPLLVLAGGESSIETDPEKRVLLDVQNGVLRIDLNGQEDVLRIYGLDGVKVKEQHVRSSAFVNVSELRGIYVVRILGQTKKLRFN